MSINFNGNRNQNTQTQDDSWKAVGFLNFTMPGTGGKPAKLGAIALKPGVGVDELIAYCAKDPANAQKLLASMTVTYNSATPQNKSKFVLPE